MSGRSLTVTGLPKNSLAASITRKIPDTQTALSAGSRQLFESISVEF